MTRVYAMVFDDRTWTLSLETPDFSPFDFRQRFTGKLSADKATVSGRWETTRGSSSRRHDFDLTYRRIPRQEEKVA